MAKKFFLLSCLLVFIMNAGYSQITETKNETKSESQDNPLKGLKKAGPEDLDPSKPIMLDPNSTPIYFENLTLVKEEDFMNALMSGDFRPEPYVDSDKNLKAFVLRKTTETEKKQMLEMQKSMRQPNQERSELLGKKASPFTVKDITGKTYSLKKLKGKVVVLNFWFVECKPCVMEIPDLNKLVDKYKGKDVVFIGLATNDKTRIENFIKNTPFNYQIISDSKAVAEMYKVSSYPTHIVIDKNSIIKYFSVGLSPTTISDIDEKIDWFLNIEKYR
jgi:peroxiredoxin